VASESAVVMLVVKRFLDHRTQTTRKPSLHKRIALPQFESDFVEMLDGRQTDAKTKRTLHRLYNLDSYENDVINAIRGTVLNW